MKINNEVCQRILTDHLLRGQLMGALKKSEATINRLAIGNKENSLLTTEAALKVIGKHLSISRSEILESTKELKVA